MKSLRLTICLIVVTCLCSASFATTYYVDFDGGSDGNAGTSSGAPWKHAPGDSNATGTPASTTLVGGDTVIFKGGVNYRGTISMNASGTSGNPITYDGNTAGTFGTGKAIIDGSQPLTGWAACTGPTDGGNNPNWANVYKIALPAGVTLFTANLYEDGTLLAMAQDPNASDPMYYDDLSTYISVPPSQVTDTPTEITVTDSTYFTQSDPNYWDGGYLHIWHNPNLVSTLAVTSFNPSTDTLTTDPLSGGNIYPDYDALYSMGNCLPILDTAGEYVVDEVNDMIYLWPLSGANPDGSDVTVSVREYGLNVGGRNYVTFDGFLIIKHSTGFTGWHNGGGVRSNVASTGLTVRDNEVTQNRSMSKYGGIYVVDGTDAVIEGNYIHENMRNRGIMYGGSNGTILNNTLYKNGGTGIYMAGMIGGICKGNVVTDHSGVHANGITLYLGCDGVDVIGNTVLRSLVALTTQDAYNLTIAYNVFQNSIDGYTVADWNSASRPSWNLEFYNNVMINEYTKALSIGENGQSGLVVRNNIIDGAGIGTGGANITHNIYTSLSWVQHINYGWTLGTGEMVETDKSVVYADAPNFDYHLAAGSPGYNAGTDVGYTEDIEGTTVPQDGVVDIGAYEYVTGANQPPNADAGPDQNVTDTDEGGDEDVTLDGSGSDDPDGTITDFDWEEASVPIATGVSPIVTLTVAVHTIDLTVTDDDLATDSDSVVVTVNPGGNIPPTADAGPDQNVTDTDDGGDEDVTLDGSGSSDSDGTITDYDWEEASVPIATGVSPLVTLTVAVHTIDLTVTDDDLATDSDSVVITVNPAPGAGAPTLTVVETAGDYYTITAHDSVTPSIEYWEVMVDVQSGCLFSFKDLTDAGDGGGGHNSYLDSDAYGRQCSLIFFDGRGGNVLTRQGPLDDLATHLTFVTAGDNSSFTITYSEDGTTTDWFHDSYPDGAMTLSPGDMETTITLVITPPDETGTFWDWTISSQNVSGHDLSPKIWAQEFIFMYLYAGVVNTPDTEESLVDGPWNESTPVSFARWTLGANPGLGLTQGREIIVDRQTGFSGLDSGGYVTTSAWAGFDYMQYYSPFDYSTALPDGQSRDQSGQVIIDIVGTAAPPNVPPTADAGPDQNVTDTDDGGDEDVTLDGSGSSDSDGTITAYDWEEASVPIASGVSPLVTLSVAVHTIDLIVTDDDTATDTDSVVITVNPYVNVPPTADAGPDQLVTDTDRGGDEDVTLDGSGSSDSDGTIVSYDWEEASVPIASGVSPLVTLTVGTHTIDLIVTDDDTDTDTDSVAIEVNDPPTADAGPDQNVTDNDDGGDEDVTLDGSGSSDSDGSITAYDWEESSVPIASGVSPLVTLSVAVHTIDLIVTDDDSATGTDSVVITVNPYVNIPPTADAGPDQNVTDNDDSGDEDVTLDGSASSDSDGIITAYDWEEASVPIASGVSPLVTLSVAIHTIDLIVTDDDLDTDTDSVVITVDPYVNVPPTADAGPDQNVTDNDDSGDEDVTLDGSASSDSDGTIAAYDWEEASVPIASGVSPLVTLSVAVHTIDLIVTDDDLDTDTDSVVITVNPYVNVPPTADAGPDQNVTDTDEGGDEDVTLDGSGSSDSDGTIVSYEWEESSVPIASGVSPVVTLTVATHTIDLTVTDDDTATDSDSVVITVQPGGAAAIIVFDAASSISGIDTGSLSWSHTIGGGNNRILIVGVENEDDVPGDMVISSVTYNSVAMNLVAGTEASVGSSWQNHTALYYLLDAALPAAGSYTVEVTYAGLNTRHCAGAISLAEVAQQVAEAVATNSIGDASDISTNITTVTDGAWVVDAVQSGHPNPMTVTAAGMVDRYNNAGSLGQTGAGSTKPVATAGTTAMSWDYDDAGTARLVHSLAAFAPTSGPPPNDPPTADAGPDQNVTDNDDNGTEDVTLDGSGSSDSDGTIVSYEWEEASVPIASGVSPLVTLSVAVHTIDLIVTDDDTDTDTDSVVVTVNPYVNVPPTADAGPDQNVTDNDDSGDEDVTLDGSGSSDSDGTITAYDWEEASVPIASGVSPLVTLAVAVHTIDLIVTDDDTDTDTDSVVVTVNPYVNVPPTADAGPDQEVTDTDEGGDEDVTLDGSGSSDSDGTIVSYEWEESSVPIASGVSPIVTLTVAVHTIDLIVTDDDTDTDTDSVVVTVLPGGTVVSGLTWQNFSIAPQTGDLVWEFDAVPNDNNMDGLTVLSLDPVTFWPDCAVTTRFNASGFLDSFDGDVYTSDTPMAYSAGTSYHFRVTVDIGAQTFSIYVTPEGSGEQTLATDYDFRVGAGSPATLNNWGCIAEVGTHTISNMTVTANAAPTADAGPDQNVTDTDDGGDEDVTLDGSGSSDSDGTIVSYEWEEASVPIASGVSPLVTLSVAVHTIDLIVTDDGDATDTDSVIITVNPYVNVPPTADAGADQNVTDNDDNGTEDVTLDGSGSSDSDGTIVSYEWEEASVPIASGVSPLVSLSVAVHTIDLIVTDDDTDTDSDSVIITVNPYVNVPPTADAGPDQNVTDTDDGGDEDVTLDGSGSSDSDGTIVSYEWEESSVPIASGVSPVVTLTVAVHTIDLTVTDDDTATDSDSVVITVDPAPSGGPNLEVGVATGIDSSWTTVTLSSSYTSMVVVGVANYDDTDSPTVVRIRNASGNSFDVRVNPAGGAAPGAMDVHYMVVEEGVYTQGTDGVTMEAVKYLSTVTDENNLWNGEDRTYANAYTSPVVLGQVMTYNDAAFSTFWCCDGARQNPPDSGGLVVGKSVAEDPVTARADETVGYIVIEAGSGTMSGIDYVAALGPDSVRGPDNSPPYTYSLSGLTSPQAVVASLAAMDGNNGGWALLYGSNPLTATTLNLAVDEDQAGDSERKHTTEQVGYIVFDN